MNGEYLDKITHGDCRDHISRLADNSIELFLSDIPYGISLDDWDVLHDNTNSALLGQSPAQAGKSAFIDLCKDKGMFYSLSCAYLKKPRIKLLS